MDEADTQPIPTLTAPATPDPFAEFTLADVEQIRLLLRGGSVIDWHRLAFSDAEQVRRFLAVQEVDPSDPRDSARLDRLRIEAIEYSERYLDLTIPPEVQATPVPDLLLLASGRGKKETAACTVLKAMHVIHHLAGRELLAKLPVADVEMFSLVEQKVLRVIEEMRRAGLPVVEFAWSRKHRDAQILKLLAKKETLAAQVYDKIRFRLVAATADDVLPLLRELCNRLVPFNYIVPGQSENALLPFRKLLEQTSLRRLIPDLQSDIGIEEREPRVSNEFSGPSYRVINFVADLPVRVDQFLCRSDDLYDQFGPIGFVLTEFQVVDQQAAIDNERGENSHDQYKERQVARVRARLTRGIKP
ncbi:MAG: TIGR04552 family protein [Myxococcota bacterium]